MTIGYNPFDEDFSSEDFYGYESMAISLKEENIRLKKQVDELTDKLGKVLSGIKMDELLVAKGIEQAVKDTAKEILSMFDDRNYISEKDLKKAIAERYGLEVE